METQRDIHGRCIFTKPRGIHRFDPIAVDNYIGEIKIKVSFEDNDYKYYNPYRLLERIERSKIDLINAKEKNFVRWYSNKISTNPMITFRKEKVVINNVVYYLGKNFTEYEYVLFDTNGTLVGVYDKDTKEITEAIWD